MNPLYVTTKGKGDISLRRISQTNSLQTMSFCNVISFLGNKVAKVTGKIGFILSYFPFPLSSRYVLIISLPITFLPLPSAFIFFFRNYE
jgi:hypothetical protein